MDSGILCISEHHTGRQQVLGDPEKVKSAEGVEVRGTADLLTEITK